MKSGLYTRFIQAGFTEAKAEMLVRHSEELTRKIIEEINQENLIRENRLIEEQQEFHAKVLVISFIIICFFVGVFVGYTL